MDPDAFESFKQCRTWIYQVVRRLDIGVRRATHTSRFLNEQEMSDTIIRKPLEVSTGGTAGPYIRVPFRQLAEICQLLDKHNIRYWVDEHVIALDGGPEIAVVNFGRSADVVAASVV